MKLKGDWFRKQIRDYDWDVSGMGLNGGISGNHVQ
jgi:hypothetical protein